MQTGQEDADSTFVRIRGKNYRFPAVRIDNEVVFVSGTIVRTASIKDEMFLQGNRVTEPDNFIDKFKKSGLSADLFMFAQKPPDVEPRYPYRFEWDNVAAISTADFKSWWEGRLSQVARKNVRRARNRGVIVKTVELTEDFLRGVQEIYNETPMRQGKPFYHYGKSLNTITAEMSTFGENSEFIGAYKDDELIGFIKLIDMKPLACIMHIVSKTSHFDKRPTNALLAEAVELCIRKGLSYLVYGNYTYGRKGIDSLGEFKRHNGFDKIEFPRYYVPLTLRGRLILALGLHRDAIGLLPAPITSVLLKLRARLLDGSLRLRRSRPRASQV